MVSTPDSNRQGRASKEVEELASQSPARRGEPVELSIWPILAHRGEPVEMSPEQLRRGEPVALSEARLSRPRPPPAANQSVHRSPAMHSSPLRPSVERAAFT